jgi:hypothetical protein
MGHSTTRAALIYQHTAMERDRAIANALGKLAEEALSKQDREDRARSGHERSIRPQATIKARVGIISLTWAFVCGAGDGNRTRAVSLGSTSITARRAADLGFGPVLSDRG